MESKGEIFMESIEVKPSRIFYGISVLVFAVGLGLFLFVLLNGIFSVVEKIGMQVIVPGTEIIELKEAGKYSIFYEYESVIDGKIYSSNSIYGLKCTLKDVNTGDFITLSNSKSNFNYSVNGREGRSVLEFVIDKPGKYEFEAWYETENDNKAVLAIGKGFGSTLFVTILLSFITLFGSLATSIIIFVITFVKRRKSMQISWVWHKIHLKLLKT